MHPPSRALESASATPSSSPLDGIMFVAELGIEYIDAAEGVAHLALNPKPCHLNSWGVVHGGVLMTLLDVTMSLAGRTLAPEAKGGATVDMSTSFLQPAHADRRLLAIGSAIHRSTTMVFCDCLLHDAEGRLIAKGMGTFKYLKRLDVNL